MAELREAIKNLNTSEAYGLAIEVEEYGYALYQKAIEITDNQRAKEDLEFLRDQEKGHKAFFEKLLMNSRKEYKADSDSTLFVWVKENLLDPVQKTLEKSSIDSYKDALNIGIGIEDKSMKFYKELKKATESKENKKAINKIIKEEKRHKKFLNIVLKYSIK